MHINHSLKKASTSFIIVTLITIISSSFNSYASEEKPDSKKRLISQVEDVDSSAEPKTKRLKADQEPKKEEGLKDAFYIFNVGQGNSQLAIYAEGLEEPFGILYDCGTSAQTVSDKILKFQTANKKEPKAFLVRNISDDQLQKPAIPASVAVSASEAKDTNIILEEEKQEGPSDESLPSSQGSFSNEAKKEKRATLIATNIRASLETIKNLFVILSHPDKDHINLLEESLPNNLNILFILCGNFFMESESEDLKADVGNLFSFIEKRKRTSSKETHVTLPYFWSSESLSPYSTLHYKSVREYVEFYPQSALPQDIDRHIPEGFQGQFSTFLQKMVIVDQQEKIEDKSKEDASPFYQKYLGKPQLNDIYIWSMNHISDDINNHSSIVSFRMPNLEKTFICTGDAGPEVFQKIQKKVSKHSLQQATTITSQKGTRRFIDAQVQNTNSVSPYTVLLMLPHHGAKGNFSLHMIDLFAPHILGISAGAGSMYNHPDTSLIEAYQEEYKKAPHLTKLKEHFWKQYRTQTTHHYVTFKDKIKPNPTDATKTVKVQTARLHELEEEGLPILATGVAGTIYINKDSYYSQYISYYPYEGKSYKMKFKRAAFEHDSTLEKLNDRKEILEGTRKVNLPDNIQEIKYKGIEFLRKRKNFYEKGVFFSSDNKKLLLPLGIKYNDGKKDKTIWKFYLGNQIEEGENVDEKK